MFWFLLVAAATFFQEISSSIGKFEVQGRKESIYTMGFLNLAWGTLFFLCIAIFIRKEFLFASASLPTFIARAILEIIQAQMTMLAITKADRSAFGFIRIGTIPLLLIIDVALGYTIGLTQVFGISLIVIALIFLLINHGIRKNGLVFVVFTTINAAITLSLFKYNITNFNSVEAEQSMMMGILLVYFFLMAFFIAKENPIQFLKKPVFFTQSFSEGIGSVLMSFAYLFAPASIITTVKRSSSILWAMGSGKIYFHEKRLILKIISFILIISGLVLLAI